LLLQIADIHARKARNADPVAGAVESVAAEASDGRAALAAAHGDDLSAGSEGRAGFIARGRAACREGSDGEKSRNRAHPKPTPDELCGSVTGTVTLGEGCFPNAG